MTTRRLPSNTAGKPRREAAPAAFRLGTYSKYKARRTEVDGIVFDSAAESRRYSELLLLQRDGAIRNLELQVPLKFYVKDKPIFRWISDFAYFEGSERVFEDVKGFRTPVYKLKAKLISAQYGITIREVQA